MPAYPCPGRCRGSTSRTKRRSSSGPKGSVSDRGLPDTGADDTVFPISAAHAIGPDLSSAPTRSADGVTSAATALLYAEVASTVTDGVETHTWTGRAAFTTARLRLPLLGHAGLL